MINNWDYVFNTKVKYTWEVLNCPPGPVMSFSVMVPAKHKSINSYLLTYTVQM